MFLIHVFTPLCVSACMYMTICFLYKGKDDTVLHLARLAAVAVDERNLHRQNRNAQSAPNGPTKRVHVLGHHIKILPEMSVKKPKGKLVSSLLWVVGKLST